MTRTSSAKSVILLSWVPQRQGTTTTRRSIGVSNRRNGKAAQGPLRQHESAYGREPETRSIAKVSMPMAFLKLKRSHESGVDAFASRTSFAASSTP